MLTLTTALAKRPITKIAIIGTRAFLLLEKRVDLIAIALDDAGDRVGQYILTVRNDAASGLVAGENGVLVVFHPDLTGGFDAIQAALSSHFDPTAIEAWMVSAGLLPAGTVA